jgi:hypothetical protein
MKRLFTLQVFSCIFLLTASVAARAEYYVVYPTPTAVWYTGYTVPSTCSSCCRSCRYACTGRCGGYRTGYRVYYETPPVVYMRYTSPRRVRTDYWGAEETADYAWVPYP